MSTYVYKSFNDKERPSTIIKGVTFTFGTSPTFSSDQLTLNELVPEQLDRFVNGVKSNDDLLTPFTLTNPNDKWYGRWSDSTGTALVRPNGSAAAFGPPSAVTYNGAGQPISMTCAGVEYALAYDAQGRLETITGGGLTQTVSYDGNGYVSGVASL